jgi:hypothetical protein
MILTYFYLLCVSLLLEDAPVAGIQHHKALILLVQLLATSQ